MNVLPPRAAGAKNVDANVFGIDHDVVQLIRLGHDGHGASRSVDPALAFGFRHALHPMDARLVFQARIASAADAANRLFATAQLGFGRGKDLALPALRLRVAQIHAHQLGRKQCGLVAARARPDFQNHVFVVVFVFGQQHELDALFRLRQLGQGFFLLGQGVGAQIGLGLHFLEIGDVAQQAFFFVESIQNRADLSVFFVQAPVARHVGRGVRLRQQAFDLLAPLPQLDDFLLKQGIHLPSSTGKQFSGQERQNDPQ